MPEKDKQSKGKEKPKTPDKPKKTRARDKTKDTPDEIIRRSILIERYDSEG
jgi:hypothetical protein